MTIVPPGPKLALNGPDSRTLYNLTQQPYIDSMLCSAFKITRQRKSTILSSKAHNDFDLICFRFDHHAFELEAINNMTFKRGYSPTLLDCLDAWGGTYVMRNTD